jgi:hypothetical protein
VVGSRSQVSPSVIVPYIPACATISLTRFSYTDTDLDPYNAKRGFWWVSNEYHSSELARVIYS